MSKPGIPYRFDHHANVEAAQLPFQGVHEINQSFYQSYPREYFEIELHAALSLITNPRQALAPLIEGTHFQDHKDSHVLQIKIDEPSDDDSSFAGAARIRVTELYYHSLETLLRLYFAHLPDVEVPWFAVSRETSFRKFRAKVGELSELPSSHTEESAIDEHVRHVFLPVAELTEEQRQALRRTRVWLTFAATELLDTYAYNAFKHGLALHEGEEKIAMYSPEQDPRHDPSGRPFVGGEGPALIYLSREPTSDDEYEWVRHSRFLYLSEKTSIITTVARTIKTCLQVGEARYVTGELDVVWLPHYLPPDVTAAARNGDFHLEGLSMPLGFVERRR